MSKQVEVYNGSNSLGKQDVTEILKQYPFLKDENFENAIITHQYGEIVFEYHVKNSGPVVIWNKSRKKEMLGEWIRTTITIVG